MLELAGVWPPAGAEAVEVDDAYERLADVGFEYGPVFQGLRGVWRRGEEVFAEVELGEEEAGRAGRLVCIRRCWMRRCMRRAGGRLDGIWRERERAGDGVRLPFSWGGVGLYAAGASRVAGLSCSGGGDGVVRWWRALVGGG